MIRIVGDAVSRGNFSTDILFSFLPQTSGMTIELLIEARTSQGDELSILCKCGLSRKLIFHVCLPQLVMFPLQAWCHSAGRLLLQLVVVREVLNFAFFLACCLLSWDQSAHLTCTQLALAVTTSLLPLQIDELVMIQRTLST